MKINPLYLVVSIAIAGLSGFLSYSYWTVKPFDTLGIISMIGIIVPVFCGVGSFSVRLALPRATMLIRTASLLYLVVGFLSVVILSWGLKQQPLVIVICGIEFLVFIISADKIRHIH